MPKTKLCSSCRKDKDVAEFTTDSSRADGLCIYCGDCKRDRMRAWMAINPKRDKYKSDTTIRSRIYRRQARESGKCINCRDPHETGNLRCRRCSMLHTQQVQKARERARREAFEAYGGPLCACCGEKEYRFLTIDHTQSNGAEHRRTVKGCNGGTMYGWLRARRFPPGYAVLCYNCNCGRALNGGICPHKANMTAA